MTTTTSGTPAPDSEQAPTKGLNATYWLCNVIEMWERLAYYTLRPVAPIYIMQATEPGGLHLTAQHKGVIYAWWAIFQSMLPMVTGGYADRYGYKRTLFVSITLNIIGYLVMAYTHSYFGFFAGIILLAIGTAFFKPSLQATLGHQLTKDTSSLGWGTFYWIVNVGSLIGHYLSPLMLGDPHSAGGWRTLFLACAGFTALNYLMLFTYKDVASGAAKDTSPWVVFWHTLKNVFEPRLITWLLIMSCFWLMMYQLWDLQPNFIVDWIDSSMVAAYVPFESWREIGDQGTVQVPQQVLISLNALLIVTLMVPVSWVVRKMRTLSTMFFGMIMATAGVLVAGLTGNGWFLLLGILGFSLGEMLTGPKKNEYLSLIAPPGKKGLYLGYVNIPIGLGVGIGSYIAGVVYDHYGEKATLALKHMAANNQIVARAARSADWSDSIHLVPSILEIERHQALAKAAESLGMDAAGATQWLRRKYRYDRGQVINLGLQYLALHEDFRDKIAGLSDGPEASPASVAAHVDELPKLLGVLRPEVGALVRERVNEGRQSDNKLTDSAIADLLWDRFGEDRETVNNLALEYLAQGTHLVSDAASRMTFEDPVDDMESKLGIDRTKSFAALSAAMGADDATLNRALAPYVEATDNPDEAVYVYLINRPFQRFNAVGRHKWRYDQQFLERLIESDADAKAVVTNELGATGPIDYHQLTRNQSVIQKALKAKRWDRSPEDAVRLLALNLFEARARAAAEANNARAAATNLLWNEYSPQYHVWLPFASIGVVAAIALAIFGQLAKRWKDMNV